MGDPTDKRKYKRLRTEFIGKIRTKRASAEEVMEAQSTIRALSLGGVFITTPTPFPRGTMINLEFQLPGTKNKIKVEGIVRWTKDSETLADTGMGIEFIKVLADSKETITKFIDKKMGESLEDLLKTENHTRLLKLFLRKMGKTYEISILAEYLEMNTGGLKRILNDFEHLELFSIEGDSVIFADTADPATLATLEALQ